MTTKLIRKTILAVSILLAGASQASAQKLALAVVFRSEIPYYSSPQASNGQPLGYFMPGTRSCVIDESLLNGVYYLEYALLYSKGGIAYTENPYYNTPAEGQKVISTLFYRDPINDIGCKAALYALLQHRPTQQQPPVVAAQPAPQQPTVAAAPRPTVSRQDTAKYLAYLEKTVKHDAEGWVMNKYISGSMTGLHVFYDKDNGSLTGLEAHYAFNDGLKTCNGGSDCNRSGWVAIKLDLKVPCLVYWDNKFCASNERKCTS
jgi:hypothetical protein